VNAPDTDQAIEFLGALFEGCPEGTVWLTSLVLPGRDGEVRSLASRDGDAIADFAARHNHPDRAMYFCPSALQPHAGGRSRETVGWITGLHADIDYKNHDLDPMEIRRRIDQAALPASLIVESGGGLHLYFLLREAIAATPETMERAERLLHSLADHVGGDHEVAHSAALMRLPGTLNCKRDAPVLARVVESRPAARYELGDLKEWLEAATRPLLVRKPAVRRVRTNGAADPFAAYAATAGGTGEPVDVELVLDSMTYGGGDNGVHTSQTRAIAAMVARGFVDEDIDRLVLEATQRAHAKSGAGPWNWQKEARAIRKSRERFQKKLANEAAAEELADAKAAPPASEGAGVGAANPLSEDAMARTLADRHSGELRYVAPWGRWMLWNGSIWKADETLAVFTRAQSICRETAKRAKPRVAVALSSARTAAAVVTMAKPRLAMVPAQFDANQWELVASTQTVDLRTGACRPPRPEDYATKRAASACAAPGTPCPLWASFLLRVTNNNPELVDFLQRFMGYCLTGATSEQVLAFLYGSGANGKTVFTSTVTGILGDYAITGPMEMLLAARGDRHETEIAKLAGARLVTAHEVTAGRRWAEARIKQLTGSDRLTARFMRQDYFDFDPTHKLLVVGNHRPTLRNLDEAVRRRFLLVPFTVLIPAGERDPQLTDKLKTEWPEILRWMVDGCLAWQRVGLAVGGPELNALTNRRPCRVKL
jgi:putative DNA primase/helicase